MTRQRLPNRRPAETADLNFDGTRYAVTIGFYPDGRPGEVFTGNARVGSSIEAVLDGRAAVDGWARRQRSRELAELFDSIVPSGRE